MRSLCGVENGLFDPPGRGVFDDDPPVRPDGRGRAGGRACPSPPRLRGWSSSTATCASSRCSRLPSARPDRRGPRGRAARRRRPRRPRRDRGRGRAGARDRRARGRDRASPRRPGRYVVSLYPLPGAGSATGAAASLRRRRRAGPRRATRRRSSRSAGDAIVSIDLAGRHPHLESGRRAAVRVLRRRGDRPADHAWSSPPPRGAASPSSPAGSRRRAAARPAPRDGCGRARTGARSTCG